MRPDQRIKELISLKTIAETLNTSNDMHQMLQDVLEKLLEVTGLTTGWIFLVEDEPIYTCIVDHQLPPALSWNNKAPMCKGSCWCLREFWDGELEQAVNIIGCKRIEDAIKYQWGDTEGITHHATVPLKAGGELFGLLNVASPDKKVFSDEELALLQSVAFQIGTAINRTKLYHEQQKRAENYKKLGEMSKELGKLLPNEHLPTTTVQKMVDIFQWDSVGFCLKEGNSLSLRTLYYQGNLTETWQSIAFEEVPLLAKSMEQQAGVIGEMKWNVIHDKDTISLDFPSAMAVPIHIRQQDYGFLFVAMKQRKAFDQQDLDVLHTLADHIAIHIENARLHEQREELTRLEERNRLARDLHDSVCQTLFSLTLTARGVQSYDSNHTEWKNSVTEIESLAQDALKEMKSLIWQLRPAGLEKGLLTSLQQYGANLGLHVVQSVEGVNELPRLVEETLWRIGQEALNNVSKHAQTNQVSFTLSQGDEGVHFLIEDEGVGFTVTQLSPQRQSLGLISMRERTELLGGIFQLQSKPGSGTTIEIIIPLLKKNRSERDEN